MDKSENSQDKSQNRGERYWWYFRFGKSHSPDFFLLKSEVESIVDIIENMREDKPKIPYFEEFFEQATDFVSAARRYYETEVVPFKERLFSPRYLGPEGTAFQFVESREYWPASYSRSLPRRLKTLDSALKHPKKLSEKNIQAAIYFWKKLSEAYKKRGDTEFIDMRRRIP